MLIIKLISLSFNPIYKNKLYWFVAQWSIGIAAGKYGGRRPPPPIRTGDEIRPKPGEKLGVGGRGSIK